MLAQMQQGERALLRLHNRQLSAGLTGWLEFWAALREPRSYFGHSQSAREFCVGCVVRFSKEADFFGGGGKCYHLSAKFS